MQLQEWYDYSKEALTRARAQVPLPSPYKADEPPAPFLRLPTIAYDRGTVKPDVAHTYAIVGWGKDLAASSLVLLYRLRVFPGRSLQECLDFAYSDFREYCHRRSKCTSIDHFSLKMLRVESHLVLYISRAQRDYFYRALMGSNCKQLLPIIQVARIPWWMWERA